MYPRQFSEQEKEAKRREFERILQKENWTFNGKPFSGRIVGYDDGIARFRTLDAEDDAKPIRRYAKRFSEDDLMDIRIYALFEGTYDEHLE